LMKRWQHVWRLLPLMVMIFALTGCGVPYLSALDPKGPVAQEQLDLMLLSMYIMSGVFVIVAIIFVYVLVRFRKRPGQDGIPEQVVGNHKLEILWTVIPIILLIILAVPTVTSTFKLAEIYPKGEAVQVKVVAHQFWWEFQYPELGIVTAQELYIPVGKKVQLLLESDDVRHAFWVPSLAGKTDNNPGMTNTMWFEADQQGTYSGKCTEICGTAHSVMNFKVVAVAPDEYDNWVASMKAATGEPTNDLASQGQAVFQANCITCHAIGGQGGAIGPDLTGFASRKFVGGVADNTPENLAQWIADPQTVKPGNLMPAFGQLKEEEMTALIEYLSNLKLGK
jgi:cytochrome c oxidase subunit 2